MSLESTKTVMGLDGATKNDCAGESQQQFTELDWRSRYQETTSEQTVDFMCSL
jgi:hypothetical protein